MKEVFTALSCVLAFSSCTLSPPAHQVVIPAIFSDHMVLQRDANIAIWGKATPHGKVTVTFNNQRSEVKASEDSTWQVLLAPEPAGGPYTLSIAGVETTTLNDVLVGEVWLASGQSNMEWSVGASNDAESEIAAAQDDQIRLFTINKTMAATPSSQIPATGWQVNSPENIAGFSAVAYYFGRVLRDSLQVPVGLIHSSWGGTRAEAWTSGEALLNHPDYAEPVQDLLANPEQFNAGATQNEWLEAIEKNDRGFDNGTAVWANADLNDDSWETMKIPQLWEEAGLPGYDGVAWFRKKFTLPAGWQNRDLVIKLAQIDDNDQTWVNGELVGQTNQFNAPRAYDVPAAALSDGENIVAIRVLDTGGGGGIWGEPADMTIQPTDNSGKPISLAGDWKYRVAVDLNDDKLPARPSGQQHTPTVLYNAMIHPIIQYRLQGAIWYQGESNASRAHQYQTLFPMLIEDWRAKWGAPIDFHFVQLANFMEQQKNPVEQETWPELREAQTMALALPQTGMAVTIDIGEADDIHPRNKQDVGLRLALQALSKTYGHNNVAAGPLYKSHSVEGNTIRIQFENAENGLQTSDSGPIKGFAIAGPDKAFRWADAQIEGNEIVASHDAIQSPVAVRYGWANNPVVNLTNIKNLPASPFRTDDWPGITVGVK